VHEFSPEHDFLIFGNSHRAAVTDLVMSKNLLITSSKDNMTKVWDCKDVENTEIYL
jgi:hypothetical protein